MRIVVLGGGATGRLVKMLVPEAVVYDAASEGTPLTREFGCNYLWEKIPGIESHAGVVHTTIDGKLPTAQGIEAYKEKIGKPHDVETILQIDALLEGQFKVEQSCEIVTGFPDLKIRYNRKAQEVNPLARYVVVGRHIVHYDLLVSTIPLNIFLGMSPEFRSFAFDHAVDLKCKPIYVKVEDDWINHDGMVYVNYITPGVTYRSTRKGGKCHIESLERQRGWHKISPGKIMPCTPVQDLRIRLRSWGILTFGRFGSWKPDELLHQTYKDIKQWTSNIGI